MSSSIRFNLPFLAPGQAQKELYHNEALQLLDIIVAACVEEPPRSTPPSAPSPGASYLVATGTGVWSGFDHHIAAFTEGGWRFVAPQEGLQAFVRSTKSTAQYCDGAWVIGALVGSKLVLDGQQVVSARGAAIAGPAGGAVIDTESRTAIQAILNRLREHGLIAHP